MYLYCLYKCSPEVLWIKEPFLPVQYKTHEMSPSLVWAMVIGPHIVWSSSHSLGTGLHDLSLADHYFFFLFLGQPDRSWASNWTGIFLGQSFDWREFLTYSFTVTPVI